MVFAPLQFLIPDVEATHHKDAPVLAEVNSISTAASSTNNEDLKTSIKPQNITNKRDKIPLRKEGRNQVIPNTRGKQRLVVIRDRCVEDMSSDVR